MDGFGRKRQRRCSNDDDVDGWTIWNLRPNISKLVGGGDLEGQFDLESSSSLWDISVRRQRGECGARTRRCFRLVSLRQWHHVGVSTDASPDTSARHNDWWSFSWATRVLTKSKVRLTSPRHRPSPPGPSQRLHLELCGGTCPDRVHDDCSTAYHDETFQTEIAQRVHPHSLHQDGNGASGNPNVEVIDLGECLDVVHVRRSSTIYGHSDGCTTLS